MAIDASTTRVSTKHLGKRSILHDNPNTSSNQQSRQHQQANKKTGSKTMKLESVQVLTSNGNTPSRITASNGNGYVSSDEVALSPANLPTATGHVAGHHKSFLEQIRRSITFSSANNFQLTKLWLFTRQSNRQSWSGTTATVKSNFNNNNNHHHHHTDLNAYSTQSSKATVTSANGVIRFGKGAKTKLNKNGTTASGRHSISHGLVPNGTTPRVKSVETWTTSSEGKLNATKATVNCDPHLSTTIIINDSSSNSTCSTQDQIVHNAAVKSILSEEVVESKAATTERYPHSHEQQWNKEANACEANTAVTNDTSGLSVPMCGADHEEECQQQNNVPEDVFTGLVSEQGKIKEGQTSEQVCNLFTDTESVRSISCADDTARLVHQHEHVRLAAPDSDTQTTEELDSIIESVPAVNTIELEDAATKGQLNATHEDGLRRDALAVPTTIEVSQYPDQDEQEQQAMAQVPLQLSFQAAASNCAEATAVASKGADINSADNGTVAAAAGGAANGAAGLTLAPPLSLTDNDEQILESLRQVVRICTKIDLKKRASIGAVHELLDSRIRSLVPRKAKVNPKRSSQATSSSLISSRSNTLAKDQPGDDATSLGQEMCTSSV